MTKIVTTMRFIETFLNDWQYVANAVSCPWVILNSKTHQTSSRERPASTIRKEYMSAAIVTSTSPWSDAAVARLGIIRATPPPFAASVYQYALIDVNARNSGSNLWWQRDAKAVVSGKVWCFQEHTLYVPFFFVFYNDECVWFPYMLIVEQQVVRWRYPKRYWIGCILIVIIHIVHSFV